jgi:hypothetical protein
MQPVAYTASTGRRNDRLAPPGFTDDLEANQTQITDFPPPHPSVIRTSVTITAPRLVQPPIWSNCSALHL